MLNRFRESQMLSSIFPKYAIVMFVIDLRKKFSLHALQQFRERLQERCNTYYTMIYKICQIEVTGQKWYVERNHF